MLISLRIPYDEARVRRTLRFLLRPQVRVTRVLGGILLVLGVALVALRPTEPLTYVAILLGLWWVFGAGPAAVSRSMRHHRRALRAESTVTLDDEWITVVFPQVEFRHRWTGVDGVAEGTEAWYVMVGAAQALTIPKAQMTPDQLAEFAAFVATLRTTARATQVRDTPSRLETSQTAGDPAVRPPFPPKS